MPAFVNSRDAKRAAVAGPGGGGRNGERGAAGPRCVTRSTRRRTFVKTRREKSPAGPLMGAAGLS